MPRARGGKHPLFGRANIALTLALLCACASRPSGGAASERFGEADTGAAIGPDTATDPDAPGESGTGSDVDTGPIADADGDGHHAVEYGGDDCDDHNSAVYLGAVEYCDAVDQDCDGEPMPRRMCGATTPAGASAVPVLTFDYSSALVGVVRDVTGDGIDDLELIRVQPYNDAFVYAGGTMSGGALEPDPATVWHYVEEEAFDYFQRIVDAGDVDGDGFNDLVIAETNGGGMTLHFGPIGGPGGRSRRISDADARWPAYMQAVSWGVAISGYDFDGDGRADVLAGNDTSGAWDYPVSDVVYDLYFGGDWDTRCPVRIDNNELWETANGRAGAIGDGDGDGVVDIALAAYLATGESADGGGWFVSGAESRLLCGAYTQDVAAARLEYPWWNGAHTPLGDWSGDGVDDWVMVNHGANPGEDAVFIMSAATPFTGSISPDDALGPYVLPDNGMDEFRYVDTLDFDGDGVLDLVLQEDSGGPTHVLRGGVVPAPHSDVPERHLVFDDETSGSLCGRYTCNGDFGGDGFDDLLVGRFTDYGEPSQVGIVRGFDVPWDDDAAW